MQHNGNSLNIPWRNYMYMRLMQFLWFNIVLGPHIRKYVHFDQILYIHHSYHQRQSEKKIQFKETHPVVIWWFSGLIYARFTPARENLCYPLKQSDSKLALSSLLTFAVNFHWLVMIFSFHLIGFINY